MQFPILKIFQSFFLIGQSTVKFLNHITFTFNFIYSEEVDTMGKIL